MKAKVCIDGSNRLKKWCNKNNIKVLECGKVISVQDPCLDAELDKLYERGIKNGSKYRNYWCKKFNEIVPNGITRTGRAIWSPKTAIVSPKDILKKLELNLLNQGSRIFERDLPLKILKEIKEKLFYLIKKHIPMVIYIMQQVFMQIN